MSGEDQKARERLMVESISRGEAPAFEEMFRIFYPILCAYAASYVSSFDEAREVVQEVFLKIWANREQWSIQVSLKSYLYSATRNQALNHLKAHKRRRLDESDPDTILDLDSLQGDSSSEYDDLLQLYEKVLARMPERRRAAFILNRQHGLSYNEIAQAMGISERTVEVHISKALEFLRNELTRLHAVGST